jgi:hypothetical protein
MPVTDRGGQPVETITLASGGKLHSPLKRLDAFLREEWAYYDAVPSDDPLHIVPLDVTVTVAMNSYVNSAGAIRRVHRPRRHERLSDAERTRPVRG